MVIGPRFVALFALVALVALVAGGCASRDRAGVVVLLEKRIPTLDPRVSSDSAAERVRQLIFNGLTRKNEAFEPVPDLAISFESSPDRLIHTFRLRDGVKFHDGRPLSAEDVKYTFETMLARGFASDKKAELARDIAAIDSPDPQTVRFTCRTPCPGLANSLIGVGIIPNGTGEAQPRRPNGTGPFVFVSYTEDQELILGSNPTYYEGAPAISELRIRITPESSTRESELRAGSADLAINADFDPVSVESLQKDPSLHVEIKDGTNITHLGVNLIDPILKDRRVRQAIAFALDRETMIRDLLRGQARPASSILPPSQWAFSSEAVNYAFDPDRARRLLDEAGRTSAGERPRFKLTLKTSSLSIARRLGESIQEQLRRVGIELEVLSLENQKLTQDLVDGNFQLYLRTLVGGNQSTDIFRYVYSSQSIPPNGQNRSRFQNPAADRLINESLLADRPTQLANYHRLQRLLSEELPQIYLWYPSTIVVANKRLSGLVVDPSGDWRALRAVRLAD